MGKKTILVVDDSDICLDVVREALEAAGYDVVTASSPLGVSRLLQQTEAACVVVDMSMPALSGDRLVDILLRGARVPVPVLLHSDRPIGELRKLAHACGATAAVAKTADGAALVREIKRLLPD